MVDLPIEHVQFIVLLLVLVVLNYMDVVIELVLADVELQLVQKNVEYIVHHILVV